MVESKKSSQKSADCKVIVFPNEKIQVVITPKKLGKGQFGQVRLAYLKGNQSKVYAVKIIERKRMSNGKSQKAAEKAHELLINEIQIMTEI